MNNILQYENIVGKANSLITIMVYEYDRLALIKYIDECLDKIKNIKDAFRQRLINDRLYSLKTKLDLHKSSMINSVFLVGKGIVEYGISNDQIIMLKEYDISNFYFKYDNIFHVGFIHDLFLDFTFYKVYELNKKELREISFNWTKKKIIKTQNIDNQQELEKIIVDADIVHGKSTLLKNLSTSHDNVYNKRLIDDVIFVEINKILSLKNHQQLDMFIQNMNSNNMKKKVVEGRINNRNYTQMSMLKKLFIHEKFYTIFTTRQKQYINFDIILIKKLNKDDISNTLLKDYEGFLGELYYSIN